MAASPLVILAAKVGIEIYKIPLIPNPSLPDLSRFGLKTEKIIMGNAGAGPVPFGVISSNILQPNSPLLVSIRGTEARAEWVDDFKAILVLCPFIPGARVEKGFLEIYQSLTVDGIKLSEWLSFRRVICHGHSLGGPLATMIAIESCCDQLILLASPKCGDSSFGATVRAAIKTIYSYGNEKDLVWRSPLTLDFPFKIEDFEQVYSITQLDPKSVNPPIAEDPASSHSLANYLTLLESLP